MTGNSKSTKRLSGKNLAQAFLSLIICLSQLGYFGEQLNHVNAQAGSESLIAFIRDGNIWLINPDGSAERRITSGGNYSEPALSPDTSKLAAVKTVNNNTRLIVLDTVTGNEIILIPAEKTGFVLLDSYYVYKMPKWDADGLSVYYISDDGRVQGSIVNRVEISSSKREQGVVSFSRGLDVSPISSKLVNVTFSNAPPAVGNGLNVADSEGNDEREVLPIEDAVGITGPCWNYDETRINYVRGDANRNYSLNWISNDGAAKGVYFDHLSSEPDWLACSPVDQRILIGVDGNIYLFNPDTGDQQRLARGSQPSWEAEIQFVPTAVPTEIPKPKCGAWSVLSSEDEKDWRIETTLITDSSGNECHGGFRFANGTGAWGFGGYTLDLEARSENAVFEWIPAPPGSPQFVFLTPLLDIELHATPLDIEADANIRVAGNATPDTIRIDSGLYLLKSALAISPPGVDCVIQEDLLIAMAIRYSSIIAYAVELAFQGDLKGSMAELSLVMDEYYQKASDYLREAGVSCGSDILEKYVIKKPLAIAELIWAYVTWIPLIFMDYWKYQGQPAEVVLKYTAQAQSPTARFGEDGKVYLGDSMIFDPSVEAPGCFSGGSIKYSPTGKHFIVLLPCLEGDNEAFIFKSGGSEKRAITGKSDYMNYGLYDWSPDGQWVVYHRVNSFGFVPSDAPTPGLVLYNVQTGIKTLLVGTSPAPTYSYPTSPAWSPDGHWIAFLYVSQQGESSIKLFNVEDNRTWQLDTIPLGGRYGKLKWETGEVGATMLLHYLDKDGNIEKTYTIGLNSNVLPLGDLEQP